MSSEKTPNLGLHKWAAPDYVQRTEFNDNFAKIDDHAKQVTEQLDKKAEQNFVDEINNNVMKTSKIDEKFKNSIFAPRNIPNAEFNTSSHYVMDLLFHLPSVEKMQSVTYYNGYYYIGIDLGNGNGRIEKYDLVGNFVHATPTLPLGHCAEMAYHPVRKTIFVANGGGTTLTRVQEVNFDTGSVINELNFEHLGTSALVAVDRKNNYLILHTSATGGDSGEHTFTILDIANNFVVIKSFKSVNKGTPQGLESVNDQIYFCTDNRITIYDYNGQILHEYLLPKLTENEGITFAADYGSPMLVMGYAYPNRLYALRTFESERFNTHKPLHPFAQRGQGNISLLPRFANIGVRFISGTWQRLNWGNYVGSDSLIDSISVSGTDLKIVLKVKFSSIGFISAQFERIGFLSKYVCHAQLESDGVTITVRVKDTTTNTQASVTSIPDLTGILIFISGGVNITA